MPTVIQNRFDGGQAEDIRTTSQYQNEFSKNFDIFTEPYRLNPYPDSIAETADVTMADSQISDVGVCTISGTDYIVGIGYESSISTIPTFYTKTDVTSAFSKQATASSGFGFIKGSGIIYKNLAYAVGSSGTTYRLYRFNGAGSVTTIGDITSVASSLVKCYVHPQDSKLYIAVGNVVATYDGSTLNTSFALPSTKFAIESITDYGNYLAMVGNDSGVPSCLLWDRDTSLVNVSNIIPLGEGVVKLVTNLGNNLFFVMNSYNSSVPDVTPKIQVKGYSGGAVDTITEIQTSNHQIRSYKAKKSNKLYFSTDNSTTLWIFGKNKSGNYTLTQDRFIQNSSAISNVAGISVIGDVIWVGANTATGYVLMRSKVNFLGESIAYTGTSQFRTTINPSMPLADRYKDKTLQSVRLAYTGASSGNTVLKYSVDGSAFQTAITMTNSAGEHTIEATADANGAPFDINGREYQFQIECTGGSKPKELAYKFIVKETTI